MEHRLMYETTFLILLSLRLITTASSNECPSDKCSGATSIWNTTTELCECGDYSWGKHCEFGRQRLTAKSGYIIESEGKYFCFSKYMYLIDSGRSNVPININVEEFATECNWDHLYIFDGRSIYDPLIASYSGLVEIEDSGLYSDNNTRFKSITVTSGAAYLYFYSDALVNHLGFNLSYIISNCTSEHCSGHGICNLSGTCSCDEGWVGRNCSQRLCCQEIYSVSRDIDRKCRICSNEDVEVSPRASHAVAWSESKIWIHGGYSFDKDTTKTNNLMMYDINLQKWTKVADVPAHFKARYGHSMVFYGNNLIIFGGTTNLITNELWRYQLPIKSWEQLNSSKGTEPIPVSGHASVVIGSAMYTFFGFNKDLLCVKYVQKYDLDLDTWSIVKTTGAIVYGTYGHTATYDIKQKIVFLFGGIARRSIQSKLLLFHVLQSKWSVSEALPMPRLLHAAGIIGRNLVIYGGNGRTDNLESNGNRCYSNSLMVYNIDCEHILEIPVKKFLKGKHRYGHSAVVYNRSMYVFGGFDGTFKSDVFQIKIYDDCGAYLSQDKCLSAVIAGCMWHTILGICISADNLRPESSVKRPECKTKTKKCQTFKECVDCTNHECFWDTTQKTGKCIGKPISNVIMTTNGPGQITTPMECPDVADKECAINAGCIACSQQNNCTWNVGQKVCQERIGRGTGIVSCFHNNVSSCEDIEDCTSCVYEKNNQCMWCESRKKCLNAHHYTVSNPYGQCLEWISATPHSNREQPCSAATCRQRTNCQKCLEMAGCGWCEDSSGTGLGSCMDGSEFGSLQNNTCPASQWYFMKCPACHCNGHSQCINGTDECEKCHGNVIGKHCDKCEFGYYGSPDNNGTCQKCYCNGHFRFCNSANGACTCNLQGATGDKCEKCKKKYSGNPINNGMCYYNLTVNYQYPQNLTEHEVAGFRVAARKKAKNMEFKIERTGGSRNAMLNISIHYDNGKSTILAQNYKLGTYSKILLDNDYEFPNDAEIRAIIYGWSEDDYFACKITVSNPPPLFNLVYFLIMFLVCFCSLLIILIVLWKIKQRYDIFIHNRQQRHEQEERISRPFRAISILLHDNVASYQKVPPSLVICEQFASGNLAVASVIIELPRADNGLSPIDQAGLCIGSTLITTPQRWTFNQIQQKYGCDRRRRKRTNGAVAV